MDSAATDWERLVRALSFYGSRGFLRTELPWHAPAEVCALTHNDTTRWYDFDNEILVGSAEQSFIHAQKRNMLPPGKYVSLTPCFRREPVTSATHLRCFMKVELFAAHNGMESTALEFAEVAREFMQTQSKHLVEIVKTPQGHDLEIGGIEVGSYSAHCADGMLWTCGTGLAEPRFSVAISNAQSNKTPFASSE